MGSNREVHVLSGGSLTGTIVVPAVALLISQLRRIVVPAVPPYVNASITALFLHKYSTFDSIEDVPYNFVYSGKKEV